jgi:hypothetical protein
MLAQHPNDLILGKSTSPHRSSPSDELTYQWHDFWGAGHEQQRADADLQAQQDMAFYALLMLVATVATVLITAVGVWLVKRTLDATLRAVEDTGRATVEMQKANDLAASAQRDAQSAQARIQLNAEAQIRAWLYVENVTIEVQEKGDRELDCALIDLKNGGNSPAFVTSYQIRFLLVKKENAEWLKIKLASVEATVNIPIPNNTIPVRLPAVRSGTDIFDHIGEDTDWSVQVDGFIVYKDVFDHERRTNFCFGAEAAFWDVYPEDSYRCQPMSSSNHLS